jgi:hypothetical protein
MRSHPPRDEPPDYWGELMARLPGGDTGAFAPYRTDPVRFAAHVLGQSPWQAQREALEALVLHPQVTIRSSHGVGKTWTAAAALLWWVYCHRPSLVLSTAPTARQVESLLWAEVGRLWQKARTPLPGRCLLTKLEASLDQTAMGLTTNEPEKFAGWHCEHLLVIVDEASGVPDSLFEVIQGTLTSAHCRLLLIGNPTRNDGYFRESHHRTGWHQRKISAYDTPNFTQAGPQEPPPSPWLVTRDWVQARKAEWGEDSDPFRVRVLGDFPKSSSDTLIQLAWIEAAAWEERAALPGDRVLGVDVARFGDCETVLAIRSGSQLAAIEARQGADLMQTCGQIVALCREQQLQRVVLDAVGLGAGVLDRLRELQREGELALQGVDLVGFESGARALDPEHHHSRRDEAYVALRDRLRDGDIRFGASWSKLTGQLCALKYGFTSRGQIKVESKDDMRRRGIPSPDWADAVALAFAPTQAAFCPPVALGSLRLHPLPGPSLKGGTG